MVVTLPLSEARSKNDSDFFLPLSSSCSLASRAREIDLPMFFAVSA